MSPPVCRVGNSAHTGGDQPGDFQIRIVGPERNTIEVYFHNQGVDLDQFRLVPPLSDTRAMECGKNVVVAHNSPSGTFAVIYGQHRDKVKAFGWKAGTIQFESFDVPVDPGQPVRLHWITTQILKAQFGTGYSKEFLLQFNAKGDTPWKPLLP
jgi:hypothetical protein